MSKTLREVGLAVKRLQMRHHRAANAALGELGVSLVQWDALRHLHENENASLHDLALLTFQSDQAFGTLATRMIERGLIERHEGPGRAVHHTLTEKGRALRKAGEKILDRVLAKSFSGLSPTQLSTFEKLLTQILQTSTDGGGSE